MSLPIFTMQQLEQLAEQLINGSRAGEPMNTRTALELAVEIKRKFMYMRGEHPAEYYQLAPELASRSQRAQHRAIGLYRDLTGTVGRELMPLCADCARNCVAGQLVEFVRWPQPDQRCSAKHA